MLVGGKGVDEVGDDAQQCAPAGIMADASTVLAWKEMTRFCLASWRMSCSRPGTKVDSKLSAANTIEDGGVASCGDLGGGASNVK